MRCYGELSELAEGARLEIVYAPKAHPGFESPTLRQNYHTVPTLHHWAPCTLRRGGRVVECGGLENRLALSGHEGSNPSSSAMNIQGFREGAFFCLSVIIVPIAL